MDSSGNSGVPRRPVLAIGPPRRILRIVMTSGPPRLVLRNGVEIVDALQTVLEFVERDASYRAYDLAPVRQDDVLTEADVRVGNAIVARMPGRVIEAFAARAPAIGAALARIPAEATLMAADEQVPWQGLQALLLAAAEIEEVGLPRATKVLHKKRPALLPILDSVVEQYLREVERLPHRSDFVAGGLDLIRAYKRELDANAEALHALRAELQTRGVGLTECRLLDILLWAYSGTYTPLWQRPAVPGAPVGDDRATTKPEAVAAPRAALLWGRLHSFSRRTSEGSVVVFRDDDAGYLEWLKAHPRGFVLNAARRPRPDYLVLHRAGCRTITAQPARGGVWTGSYIKVCGDDDALDRWAEMTVGALPRRCPLCR